MTPISFPYQPPASRPSFCRTVRDQKLGLTGTKERPSMRPGAEGRPDLASGASPIPQLRGNAYLWNVSCICVCVLEGELSTPENKAGTSNRPCSTAPCPRAPTLPAVFSGSQLHRRWRALGSLASRVQACFSVTFCLVFTSTSPSAQSACPAESGGLELHSVTAP